ncbi:MAG: right-handed parallel beta-helix repeat-containing protein [Fibrobacteria bacterium]|nr:right-handed parallel beta-helix repeat-containing protein [Fibrobacteria bacterium]
MKKILIKKWLLTVLVLFGMVGFGYGSSITVGTLDDVDIRLSEHVVWDVDTVNVMTHVVFMPGNSSLTIQKGTHVIFHADTARLNIMSTFSALGTKVDSIWFIPSDTSVGWGGIEVLEVSNISFCHFGFSVKGALSILSDSVSVRNTIFIKNKVNGWGGGVKIGGGKGVSILKCIFTNNQAESGGAIQISTVKDLVVEQCHFMENYASKKGGALFFNTSNSAKVGKFINCTITNNTCDGSGGGMSLEDAEPTFINCVIADNWSGNNGGGVHTLEGARPKLINCTVAFNYADNSGGGLYTDASGADIINCLFAKNKSKADGNHLFDRNGMDVNHKIEFSAIGNGYLLADTAARDLRQDKESNTINAGKEDTTGLGLPTVDLDGNPRIVDGRVDQGAYEHQEVTELVKDWQSPRTWWAEREDDVITFTVLGEYKYGLQLYDVTGTLTGSLSPVFKDGETMYRWCLSLKKQSVTPGMYIVRLKNQSTSLIRGTVLVR